ncbi:hypothetical protein TGAMA5MH_01293 [Trichoderma gamsii]|uniref:NAD-dependent epimerase/dehydratase domain-containing protein n=1 Tax=Trichoderma gamsii TaxID=398673 RepID=A0A2K0TPL4_9HYPO|nr:hypothetical protein TGAMA5MH_01293 [Trichoderma gamsii]
MATKGDQTILVTGANSFIAGHIVAQALAKGYKVSGTVRSEEAASKVRKAFDKHQSQLRISIVADIKKPELYESAFASASAPVTAVIHTASPFTFAIKDNETDLLKPAIEGSTAILKAVKQYGGSVRHVVSTSSFAGVADLTQGLRPGYTYTDKDWAPFTYEFAKDADIVLAYGASKALAEKAMWEFVEKEQVAFTLTTINPPWVFGPHQGGPPPLANLNVSTGMLWRLVDSPEVPPPDFLSCADVRDVAAAHIAAIEKADAAGKRFLIGSKFTYQDAVDIARETIVSLRDRLPKGTPGAGKELETYTLDKTQVEGLLGRALTPVATTITDTLTQLLEAK